MTLDLQRRLKLEELALNSKANSRSNDIRSPKEIETLSSRSWFSRSIVPMTLDLQRRLKLKALDPRQSRAKFQ